MPVVPFLIATCVAAGLNVYATVATLGLVARAGLVELPGSLGVVEHGWVIGICLVMVAAEFIADSIPLLDLLWNALQTAVRVPVAGVLAYAATAPLDPEWQLAAALCGSAVALVAHVGKVAAHSAIATSPEPVSNIGLSIVEDAVAIGLTWFATQYPLVAAAIALVLLAAIGLAVRWVVRLLTRSRRRGETPA